jgi:hypothetical protein
MLSVKFSSLEIGDIFECYGDSCINYNYPKICKCVKTSYDSAEEIDGSSFLIHGSTEVFVY